MQQESLFEKLTVIFLFISSSAFLSIRLCIISIRWGMGRRVNYPGCLGSLLTHHFQGCFLCSKCRTGASESRWPCSSCIGQHSRRWTGLVDNWQSKSCLEPQPNWREGARVRTNPGIGMQSSPKRPCLHFLKVSKMGADQHGLNISLSLTKL